MSALRTVAERFYAALAARDRDAVERIIDRHFAPDALLLRPPSLPGGGTVAGAAQIKRLLAGACAGGGALDLDQLRVIRVLEDDRALAAELEFPYNGNPGGAVEVWQTGDDDAVCSVKAFYCC